MTIVAQQARGCGGMMWMYDEEYAACEYVTDPRE